jgi:hypothetical protein
VQVYFNKWSAIAAYLKTKSPTVQILEEKIIISTPEDKLASTVVENMKETIKKAKHQRSDEARAAVNLIPVGCEFSGCHHLTHHTLSYV